jgi:SsrA-binding protein
LRLAILGLLLELLALVVELAAARALGVPVVLSNKVSFQDSFARVERGEVWLYSLHISPYKQANRFNEDPVRSRKLLLNKDEIRRLAAKVEEKGLTLVPLDLYFRRGVAKMTIAVARGRKLHDKREKLKKQTQDREAQRAIQGAR